MVGDVAKNIPKINNALEDHQEDYQPDMVEFEGKIANPTVSILIDPGASLSYVSPKIVETCHLSNMKFKNSWLVQLATGAKRRVIAKVEGCPVEIGGQHIKVKLKILPLGSYDILIRNDWLEGHWFLVNYKDKTISFFTDEGNIQEIQGIKRNINLRTITTN